MKFKVVDELFKTISEIDFKVPKTLNNKDDQWIKHQQHLYNRFVRSRFRITTACTKSRCEVAVTGAKAYKQKGTGNARRGRNSSPLLRGGAVSFGPKPRSFAFKLNKKTISIMKLSLLSLLNDKIIILGNNVKFKKTKGAATFISKIQGKKILFLCSPDDYEVVRPFQNIPNIIIEDIRYYEPELMLTVDAILVSEKAFAEFQEIK